MKYAISKEFGFFAHFHPPAPGAALPLVNAALSIWPRGKTPPGLRERKQEIPVGDGGIPALLLEPDCTDEKLPCLVYLHGGAFTMKAAFSHYAMAREYAAGAKCRVIMPDYRLAPRFRYPVPVSDCFDVLQWAAQEHETLNIDPRRIAVGGDSAGGCLAASVCLTARDAGARQPCFLLMLYPVTDRRMNTGSMLAFTDTPMWNAKLTAEMWRQYLPPDIWEEKPCPASPMEAKTLAGLPDAYVETAEFDCLRDEGALFAAALAAAGSAVELNETHGTMHGFDAVKKSPIVRLCVTRRLAALRRAFTSG